MGFVFFFFFLPGEEGPGDVVGTRGHRPQTEAKAPRLALGPIDRLPLPPLFFNFIIGALGEVTCAMRTHSTP